MQCSQCPISLNCYANRLGINATVFTHYCPKCHRIIHMLRTGTGFRGYAFACALSEFINQRISGKVCNPVYQSWYHLRLTVVTCIQCSANMGALYGRRMTWENLE